MSACPSTRFSTSVTYCEAVMLIVILLLVVGLPAWSFYSMKQKARSWEEAAAQLGLEYRRGTWGVGEMAGTVRGISVSVSIFRRGNGDSSSSWTRYQLGFPSGGPSVSMEPESFLSGWKALIGMKGQDIVVGDPAFDKAVIVRGEDPDQVKRFLSPARRMAALTVFDAFSFGQLSENHISAETRGVEASSERIVHSVQRLIDIAMVVSAPNEVDLALQYQDEGLLSEAVTALHDVNAAHLEVEVPNSFTQLLEAEALMAMSDGFQAAKALDAIAIGEDEELAGWAEVAAAHPAPPTRPTKPVAVEPAQPVLNLEQQAVIDDLFTSHRQSYETEDYFLTTYFGMTVQWTGTLERTREFRYDSVFDGTGQRAVVKIGVRGNGVLVTSTVDAIVHFPLDVALTEDQEVRFEGELVRLDFYMRNLYIADGRMI